MYVVKYYGEPREQTVLPATKSVQLDLDPVGARFCDITAEEVGAVTGGDTAEDKNANDCADKKDEVAADGGAERVVLATWRPSEPGKEAPLPGGPGPTDAWRQGHSRGGGGDGGVYGGGGVVR